jgi:hypothetical protein
VPQEVPVGGQGLEQVGPLAGHGRRLRAGHGCPPSSDRLVSTTLRRIDASS